MPKNLRGANARMFGRLVDNPMTYLYGDSSASAIETNVIEFLRDALDASVKILLAKQRMTEHRSRSASLERNADAEIVRLETLGATVEGALSAVSLGGPDTPTAQCALAITQASSDAIGRATQSVRGSLGVDIAKNELEIGNEREACASAIEALLLKHDFPESTISYKVAASGGRYSARVRGVTPFGLDATLALEIPSGHLFSQLLRVDKIVERLEVQAPEVSGWLNKQEKLRTQRLEKETVVDLAFEEQRSVIKLRVSPDGNGGGYNVIVRPRAPKVQLVRVSDQGEPVGEPFDTSDSDTIKILDLYERLLAACRDLDKHRKSLLDASLDGTPLKAHEAPNVLVERLIESLTPVVTGISRHSLSPMELVLKRLLDNGRREEIFVSKLELSSKLDPLPLQLRALFRPLGFDAESSATPPTVTTSRPPPFPSKRPSAAPPRSPPPMQATVPSSSPPSGAPSIASAAPHFPSSTGASTPPSRFPPMIPSSHASQAPSLMREEPDDDNETTREGWGDGNG
ncbi:MAG: hypothetical protein NVS3B20_17470 [Polyangiales bacterium]